MELITTENIQTDKWEEICLNNMYISPFQTNDYFNFINSVHGYSAEVFAVENDGAYTSLIVVTIQKEKGFKKPFSRRGIIYGGPLVVENNIESLSLLIRSISNYYKSKLIYIEIRNFFNYSKYSELFLKQEWIYLPYLNFTIELNDKKQEDILSGMNYNRRREIRLSLDNGAFHKVCESEDELRILYNILEELYKKKVKLPLPDYEYFRMLWQSKTGKVFVVMHQGKIIGGSICAFMDKISIYTMYYCGLRDYNKKIFPSNLAVLAAIVYAIQNGMKLLDFMGAGLKGEEYGVRKYKQEFGGTLNEYGRYRKILQPFWFKIGLKGIEMLKRQGQLFSTT